MSVSDISLEDAISSGSEYQIDTDQTSTTDSAKGNQKSGHQSRPRATRMKIRQQRAAVPFTSTPTATACANAAASFLLSDCETEDDHQFNLDKRCFSEKQHTEDILQIMEDEADGGQNVDCYWCPETRCRNERSTDCRYAKTTGETAERKG
ncbi:uncharacterized protein LOC124271137 [Haliotis rubra]|uniref:uncharacterized protein LOC124271137 n=1 Tax=Haliotis rubra TaxID=36100 RepID=UPI001EE54806|nr:uncharacterized protein LOC124271137 [Haliotis rubra]